MEKLLGLFTDNAKYTLVDAEYGPSYLDPTKESKETLFSFLQKQKKRISDLDQRIDSMFKSYTFLCYFNLIYFFWLSIGSLIVVFLWNQTPSMLFWIIFMLRNFFLIGSMLITLKAKRNRDSDVQNFAIHFMSIALGLTLVRWFFHMISSESESSFDFSIPWPSQIRSLMNITEIIISVFGLLYLLCQARRLKALLQSREDIAI